MKRSLPILSVLAVLAGVLVAIVTGMVVGYGRFSANGQDSVAAETQVRWLNVTVNLPASGAHMEVLRDVPFSASNDRYTIRISPSDYPLPANEKEDVWPELVIDAETGAVVSDTLSPLFPNEGKAILASIRVTSEPPDVWPYTDRLKPNEPSEFGSIQYLQPHRSSGVVVYEQYGQCAGASDCVAKTLVVSDGRSLVRIRGDNGAVESWSGEAELDAGKREYLQRYADSVVSRDSASPTPSAQP